MSLKAGDCPLLFLKLAYFGNCNILKYLNISKKIYNLRFKKYSFVVENVYFLYILLNIQILFGLPNFETEPLEKVFGHFIHSPDLYVIACDFSV